jgi:hypothetical protein
MSTHSQERLETLKAHQIQAQQQTESEFRSSIQKKHESRVLLGDIYKARKALESLDERGGVERWEMWVPVPLVVVNSDFVGVGNELETNHRDGVHSGAIVYNNNLHQMISEQTGMQNEVVELESEEKERDADAEPIVSEFEALEVMCLFYLS